MTITITTTALVLPGDMAETMRSLLPLVEPVALAIHPNPKHPKGMLAAIAVKDTVRIYDLNKLPKP